MGWLRARHYQQEMVAIAVSQVESVAPTQPMAVPVFAEVYESYFPFVWRSARRLGMPDAALEDVTQEIFLVVYRRLPTFEGRSSLKTWLFAITALVVRAQRRELLRKHPHTVRAEAEGDVNAVGTQDETGPHAELAKREAARVVSAFLESLDDEKREVFILADLEQMTAPDIAAALGVNVNTVYSRLRLARQALTAAIARHRARDARRMT
jgi:RNA polymerase sigma-70 factor (ECF subfamily)